MDGLAIENLRFKRVPKGVGYRLLKNNYIAL